MPLHLAIAQINPLVGAIADNAAKILHFAQQAYDHYQANVLLTPELALTGYPPEDLLLHPDFATAVQQEVQKLAAQLPALTLLLGYPHYSNGKIYNAAAVIQQGKIQAIYHKQLLPNYGVFDEKRYFTAGDTPLVVEIAGVKLGVTICEDLWKPGIAAQTKRAGAEVLLSLNASPFHRDKIQWRQRALQHRILETRLPIIYANLVGQQDELLFDGGSLVVDATGKLYPCGPYFQEALIPLQLDTTSYLPTLLTPPISVPDEEALIYQALVAGTRDYLAKNRFSGAIIGVSGGIDSALTLAIAVDALGAENIHAVIMPSRYTSEISILDAQQLIANLGITQTHLISIEPTYTAFLESLAPVFQGLAMDTTEENLQARCRGTLLMALSNKTNKLVLTTGNKSELAVGYCTLYGDMAGGFAVLKDVSKTWVYRLANYRNQLSPVIPERIITRPPSAELAFNQKDEDTLPPYAVLDGILECYLENNQSLEEIVASGFARETVRKVIHLVNRSEYKRRQAAPGIRVTHHALSRDRRYPITSGFQPDL